MWCRFLAFRERISFSGEIVRRTLLVCGALAGLCQVTVSVAVVRQDEVPVRGELHALTVFACFREEAASVGETVPGHVPELFDILRPGSLSHYYVEMSRGQFTLSGDVVAACIAAPQEREAYLAPRGDYGVFVRDILAELDQRLDLGEYDNDGPDGSPNSGDDDGFVDFLFVLTRTAPQGFIKESATGIAGLGLSADFVTTDRSSSGGYIKVRADGHRMGAGGVVQRGHTFEVAAGSMAHEFGHFLGLVDLYDLDSLLDDDLDPHDDSAGIGYWGLMGHGNRGWNEAGGPNPISAWSLKRLGWLGRGNSQLQVVTANIDSAVLRDVNAGGTVYQLPIRDEEYLLVECRLRANSYYERNLPAEGVLIWHVVESRSNNNHEQAKRVDLVCADGLYQDAGYPRGQEAAPFSGRDNLDFWAHNAAYRESRAGNLGDATDVYDGERFTDYWVLSNPAAPSGVSVTGIRRQASGFRACLRVDESRRAGPIDRDETWSGDIHVVGDVTVGPGARLSLGPGAHVRLGPDGLRQGVDPARTELIILGDLRHAAGGREPVRFTSSTADPRAGDWYGIRWRRQGAVTMYQMTIEYPVVGVSSTQSDLALDLREVVVRSASSDGIRVEHSTRGVELRDLQVHDCGGRGAVLQGSGVVAVTGANMTGNARGGLVRSGGALECTASRFAGNGAAADTAANMSVGTRVFGRVQNGVFVDGVGLRCAGTSELLVTGNRFVNNRVSIVSMGARPQIRSNIFEQSDLVFEVDGFAVPSRVDLNVVQAATGLVVSRAAEAFVAKNNWWGTADEEWIEERMTGNVVWRPYLGFDPREDVDFSLAQNYPNPFNGSTVIPYSVGINELVVTGRTRTLLEVRDITGGLVRRLVDTPAAAGVHRAEWDGRDDTGRRVASGVYYYELRVGPIVDRRQLLLLK